MKHHDIHQGPWGEWSFVVDTDTYAGNFECELLAHVAGVLDRATDSTRAHRRVYVDEVILKGRSRAHNALDARALVDSELNPLRNLIAEGTIQDPVVSGFGQRAYVTIYPTPGWSNNGNGLEYRVTRRHPFRHPSYQSVRIFLNGRPTQKQLALMQRRSEAFCRDHMGICKIPEPIKVLGFRLIREATVTETVPVRAKGKTAVSLSRRSI